MGRCILAPLVVALALSPSAAVASPNATTADKNCSDFSTHQEAQQYFDSHGGSSSNNVDGLDADHDGIACESLPSGGGGNPPPSKPPALFNGKCKRGPHPDTHCTPGAAFSGVTASQVCTPGYSKGVRNVPQFRKNKVYAEYGIRRHSPGAYEVDHLISLELGGSKSIKNLWPEKQPDARSKDKLENKLHAEVCAGTISLRTPQRRIVRWAVHGRGRHPRSNGRKPGPNSFGRSGPGRSIRTRFCERRAGGLDRRAAPRPVSACSPGSVAGGVPERRPW